MATASPMAGNQLVTFSYKPAMKWPAECEHPPFDRRQYPGMGSSSQVRALYSALKDF